MISFIWVTTTRAAGSVVLLATANAGEHHCGLPRRSWPWSLRPHHWGRRIFQRQRLTWQLYWVFDSVQYWLVIINWELNLKPVSATEFRPRPYAIFVIMICLLHYFFHLLVVSCLSQHGFYPPPPPPAPRTHTHTHTHRENKQQKQNKTKIMNVKLTIDWWHGFSSWRSGGSVSACLC